MTKVTLFLEPDDVHDLSYKLRIVRDVMLGGRRSPSGLDVEISSKDENSPVVAREVLETLVREAVASKLAEYKQLQSSRCDDLHVPDPEQIEFLTRKSIDFLVRLKERGFELAVEAVSATASAALLRQMGIEGVAE